ncbi:hypothetical protein PR048_021926 [Dryococelus australis]|uniref:Uncharacterized protein n=1 Tax=Dryococelus australis TaxID=614101 RepID=A0ABQ9GZJ7_9NEOP|nr:hypothetical protein PR048_021926 [Dryococelus australis]
MTDNAKRWFTARHNRFYFTCDLRPHNGRRQRAVVGGSVCTGRESHGLTTHVLIGDDVGPLEACQSETLIVPAVLSLTIGTQLQICLSHSHMKTFPSENFPSTAKAWDRTGFRASADGINVLDIENDGRKRACVSSDGLPQTHEQIHRLTMVAYRRLYYQKRLTTSGSSLDSNSGGSGFDSRSGHPDFGCPWFSEITPGEFWDGSLTKAMANSFPNPSSVSVRIMKKLSDALRVGRTPVGTPRRRSRSEGAIRATPTRTSSASSLLRARRIVFPTPTNTWENSRAAGAAVDERSDRSPSTKANWVRFPAGSLTDSRKWGSRRTMPLVGEFSRGSPVCPRPCITTLLHSRLISTSSALKTSLKTLKIKVTQEWSGEIWATLNIEVLRADEDGVSAGGMEGCWKTGDTRENLPTSDIVRTIPICENMGATPPGIEPIA